MLSILHAHSGNIFGGIEHALVALAKTEGAMHQQFAVAFDARLSHELRAAGASVTCLDPARLSRPWTVWRARNRLHTLLREVEPNVMLVHSLWSLRVFGKAARRARVPLALWLHAAPGRAHWLERLGRRTPPNLIVSNSQFTASAVPDLFASGSDAVVHPPVQLVPPQRTRDATRAALGADRGTLVIVSVGRLESLKGHDVLIRAAAALPPALQWQAWIVGGTHERSYERKLTDLVTELGVIDRVKMLGERTDVPALLAAADVYCQPNVRPESFGISFVEALHAALPVVTSDIGGAREIVTSDCGVLVPPGDVRAVTAAISSLVSADRRRRLGDAGPARVRQLCDPQTQATKLAAALERAALGARR